MDGVETLRHGQAGPERGERIGASVEVDFVAVGLLPQPHRPGPQHLEAAAHRLREGAMLFENALDLRACTKPGVVHMHRGAVFAVGLGSVVPFGVAVTLLAGGHLGRRHLRPVGGHAVFGQQHFLWPPR